MSSYLHHNFCLLINPFFNSCKTLLSWLLCFSLLACGESNPNDEAKNSPPQLSFTSPNQSQTFVEGDHVTVTATASDQDGNIQRLDLYINDVLVSSDAAAPYTWNDYASGQHHNALDNLSIGEHTLRIMAIDNDGAESEVKQSIMIDVAPIDNNPDPDVAPTLTAIHLVDNVDLSLIQPVIEGATININDLPETINFTALVDSMSRVGSVEFSINSCTTVEHSDNHAPFTAAIDSLGITVLAPGSCTITAVPYEGENLAGIQGSALTINFMLTNHSENQEEDDYEYDDTNPHHPDSPLHGEHSAVLNLVPHQSATHIAVRNGSWLDSQTWRNGQIPDNNARVLIPENIHVVYSGLADTRLFTLRVDGELSFSDVTSSRMFVDTLVVDSKGSLTIGTEDAPISQDVTVDIIITDNGDIDVAWDSALLSRGIIAHGKTRMHGKVKTVHLKVLQDPMAGDQSIVLRDAPVGWNIGDTIVLAGTHYDGYKFDNTIAAGRHFAPEDEVLTITQINGSAIHFNRPLEYNHDTPRSDLKTSVANYTRNITIQSELGAEAQVHHRGHVMFMHNNDVDVRFVAFNELGRTDKSRLALNGSEFPTLLADSNVKGRYPMHFHRTGVNNIRHPGIAVGNAVFSSPGWGYVHHDSNAIMHDNAAYNTFGAGFVAETGNEIGAWSNNIAIYAKGTGWASPKNGNDVANFDMGKTGSGFYFQGRMVEAFNNIASSTNSGFTYFHRGRYEDVKQDLDGNIPFNAAIFSLPEALDHRDTAGIDDAPILNFKNNESFASNYGFFIEKSNTSQGHDVRTILEDFTAWDVVIGAHFAYTSHYLVKGFDLIGTKTRPFRRAREGIELGVNASDFTVVDAKIDGFETGIEINDRFTGSSKEKFELKQHIIIDPVIINSGSQYNDYNPATLQILSANNLVPERFDVIHDKPLTFDNTERRVMMQATKIDSIGTIPLPAGIDDYDFNYLAMIEYAKKQGYYSADGKNYFILEDYYSDRASGEIHKRSEWVEIDSSVNLQSSFSHFRDATYRGEVNPNSQMPVANNDIATTSMETEVTINLLANDTDPDGDALYIDGIVQPLAGTVYDNGDGTITYRPGFEFIGSERIKFWVSDGQGNFAPAFVTVEVNSF